MAPQVGRSLLRASAGDPPGGLAVDVALGKIYQLLGDLDMAFLWFAKANAERPNHPDLVRDASRAAMDVGAPKKHWRCVGRRWLSGQMIRCWSAT